MTSPQLDGHAIGSSIGSSSIGSSSIGSSSIGSPDIGSPDIGSPDIGSPDIGSSSDGWEALRQPGALGIALFDVKTPRCVAADPPLCAALGYEQGALDGVAITEIEVAHP